VTGLPRPLVPTRPFIALSSGVVATLTVVVGNAAQSIGGLLRSPKTNP